jgi:hypothetical protein
MEQSSIDCLALERRAAGKSFYMATLEFVSLQGIPRRCGSGSHVHSPFSGAVAIVDFLDLCGVQLEK